MPMYEVLVTVQVSGETQQEAYGSIRHALEHAKKAEIVHVDSEVIREWDEESEAESGHARP